MEIRFREEGKSGLLNTFEMEPDFSLLRRKLLKVIKDYERGTLTYDEAYWAVDNINDEFFPKEYPELDTNDIRYVYMQAMFLLEMAFDEFPESINLANQALHCKKQDINQFIEKLDHLGELTKW